jgi:hypothetical protein
MQKTTTVTTAEGVNETCVDEVGGSPGEVEVARGTIHVGAAGSHFPSWGLDWSKE